MSYQLRNYRMRREEDRWDAEVVARFDCAILIGEEPFSDQLVFREVDLTEIRPGIFRIAAPATEAGDDAFSLPECWSDALKELAVAKYRHTKLFSTNAHCSAEAVDDA